MYRCTIGISTKSRVVITYVIGQIVPLDVITKWISEFRTSAR